MPPLPNFARKKRKSRSRGSSAKRAPRNRNATNCASKPDPRSASVDVATCSSDINKESVHTEVSDVSSEEGILANSSSNPAKNSLILSLADNVATAAIVTAETALKDSPKQKNMPKKGKHSAQTSSSPSGKKNTAGSSVSHAEETSKNSLLHEEEEKLNNLCKLLERLGTTYGSQNTCDSPSSFKSKAVNLSDFASSIKENCPTNKFESNNTVNEIIKNGVENIDSPSKNTDISQEEKQALRKAKKELKKTEKNALKKVSEPPHQSQSNAVNSITDVNVNGIEEPSSKGNKNEMSKAELRKQRREKQEAQRAAKEATKLTKVVTSKNETTSKEAPKLQLAGSVVVKPSSKKKEAVKPERHLPLLEHLSTQSLSESQSVINSNVIHPAIRAVGLRMKDMIIDGCISRVLATLSAICSLIEDYQTPPSCDLSRDLSNQLSPNIDYLNSCRPISEPINNAIRFVKREINEVSSSVPELQAKEDLSDAIQTYVKQNIVLASEAIIENAQEFIENDDVILTFGFSILVYETVKTACKKKENLSVVVVDNPGVRSGVNILPKYVQLGVKTYYRIQPDLPHIIKKVTKVIVEAEAVVLNGAVIGYCGMAGLILVASAYSVPVIVLSHTFKFCNIDLTDSLVFNELGNSSVIVNCKSEIYRNHLADWRNIPSLNVVNLVYDVTPPRLINVLVTERSNYPTSVVPVIIKRNYADILGHD